MKARIDFSRFKLKVIPLLLLCLLGCDSEDEASVSKSKKKAAKMSEAEIESVLNLQMETISQASKAYFVHTKKWPSEVSDLLSSSESGWKGPYLEEISEPKDVWGNSFSIEGKGKRVTIKSAGENGKFGDSDDKSVTF